MTDKKLTDEEIIKRLERCVKRGNRNYNTDIVLDLINRQKAEIERLEKTYKADQRLISALNKSYNLAKAEAYKEFAERLCEGKVSNDKTVIEAKVLLEEMVGDEE